MFTEERIQELISCQKKILTAPKISPSTRGSIKKEFTMCSIDGEHTFRGFLSQNEMFPENFSLGLIFEDKVGKDRICLLRCNGTHGGNKNIPHHFVNHIHRVTAEDIKNGIRAERKVELTREYSTYETAIQFYLTHISVIAEDRQKHFPPLGNTNFQTDLFGNTLPF